MTRLVNRTRSQACWPRRTLIVGLTTLVAVIAACGNDDPTTLGEAQEWASGGDTTWAEVRDRVRSDDPDEIVKLDDVPLQDAAIVMAGSEADSLVVLFERDTDIDHLVTASTGDGAIHERVMASVSIHPTQTSVDITASGDFVLADDDNLGRALGGEPAGPDEPMGAGANIGIYHPGFARRAEYPSPFPVGALDLAEDDTVLAGGLHESRIARIDPDGTTTQLLGPPGSGARVTADPAPGPVIAVMPLDDDRVVFVAGTDGDTRLYLLDDSTMRQIPDNDEGASPVAGTDERRVPSFEEAFPRPAITPLAPSPDGRVLTTGIGPDGDPQIALVDIDTGDIEVLAILDGVEPGIDDPVSAAIVGNDLVFIAQHQIWRLPDVVTADG